MDTPVGAEREMTSSVLAPDLLLDFHPGFHPEVLLLDLKAEQPGLRSRDHESSNNFRGLESGVSVGCQLWISYKRIPFA
jgi:hypothetical protein